MSKIKRYLYPDIYELIDGVEEAPTMRDQLEARAKQSVCACWHYDLANAIEDQTEADLKAIINNPYHMHEQQDEDDWRDDCPQYKADQAEAIRDAKREGGCIDTLY